MTHQYDMTDISTLVRNSRHELGMSQVDVAASAGVSRPVIVRLEQGGDIMLSSFQSVANVLGLKITVTPATK